ncbi:MAG: c-type cytochrome [Microscillaceae bacterium]|nr:c-type cytochrome [Microscillaceae bacterium]
MKRLNVFLFTFALLICASIWFSFRFYKHHQYDHFKRNSPDQLEDVAFSKVDMPKVISEKYTTLCIGPDHKLYAGTLHGRIVRYHILEDGILKPDVIFEPFGKDKKLMIGLEFDPQATAKDLTVWISYSNHFDVKNGPAWDSNLSRLKLSSKNNQIIEHTHVLDNLPRSARDHLTNSLDFGPDGALYFSQGSNTSMGKASDDKAWDYREETLLTASILRLDTKKLPKKLPLDVKTLGEGGNYNPYDSLAPLTIYATGVRNAYDLVWHSNGQLYAPVNGSMGGFDAPSSDPKSKMYVAPNKLIHYKGPKDIPGIKDIQDAQHDFLFRIEKGRYYGHPNPTRGEYIVGRGHRDLPYPEYQKVKADPNYHEFAYDFGAHASPNGIIEYKSNSFDGRLQGKLIVVRFNLYFDLMILNLGDAESNYKVKKAYDGEPLGVGNLDHPLDLVEDVKTGFLYVTEIKNKGTISLFKPKKLSKEDKILAQAKKEKSAQGQLAQAAINADNVTLLKDKQQIEAGKNLFLKNCTVCHTTNGEHAQGPNLFDREWIYGSDMKAVFNMIQNGSSKGMLAWKKHLSPEEIQKVASFILDHQKDSNSGTLTKKPQIVQ